MDKRTLSICVFCGSSPGVHARYQDEARALGMLIGKRGHRLVFGGGSIGLMGKVATAVSDAGGTVIGILPRFLRHLEPPLKSAEELVIVPDMQERKARMLKLADAFVILPGGLGTLDEVFEVLTTAQLDQHTKPIVLVNVEGHFDPLLALLKHVVKDGFARPEIHRHYRVVANALEAMNFVEEALSAHAGK